MNEEKEQDEDVICFVSCLFEANKFGAVNKSSDDKEWKWRWQWIAEWNKMRIQKEAVNNWWTSTIVRKIWWYEIQWHFGWTYAMNVWRIREKFLERRLDGDKDVYKFHKDNDLGIEDSGGQLNGPHYGVARTVADTWLVGFHAHNYRWAKSYFNWNSASYPGIGKIHISRLYYMKQDTLDFSG